MACGPNRGWRGRRSTATGATSTGSRAGSARVAQAEAAVARAEAAATSTQLAALRAQLSAFMKGKGVEVAPDGLIVTTGSQQAPARKYSAIEAAIQVLLRGKPAR